MIKIKNFLLYAVLIVVIIMIAFNIEKISSKIISYNSKQNEIIIKPSNDYTKNKDYAFVKHTTDFEPDSYSDLINIFYTLLDQGWDEFTFYCPSSYTTCLDDVTKISKDKVLLSSINNYVHPYNSYSSVKIIYDELGEVTIKIAHLYTKDEINKINIKINQIYANIINDTMDRETKVKTIHDYIINNTKYDIDKANNGKSNYDSSRATGVLFEGYGICSGYTDVMAIFLNKIGVDNFKVSSDTHIWNAINYNNNWYHIDATWDDPVSQSGVDSLSHDYFIINTQQLKNLDVNNTDHNFDNKYYLYFS